MLFLDKVKELTIDGVVPGGSKKNKKTDYNGSLEDALRLVDTPGLKTIALSVVKLFEK